MYENDRKGPPLDSKWLNNFLKLFLGQSIAGVSTAIVNFSLLWYLTFKSHSPIVLSIADIFAFLPLAVLSPFAGPIIDRFNKKMILITADTIVMVVALSLYFHGSAEGGNLEYWAVFIAMFIRGAAQAFQIPTAQSITPTIIPDEKLLVINGYYGTIQGVQGIAAPAIGAALYSLMSISNIILLNFFGALVGAITVFLTSIPEIPRSGKLHLLSDLKTGIKSLLANKAMTKILLLNGYSTMMFMSSFTLYPLMSTQYFHGGIEGGVTVEIFWAVGIIIGSFFVGFWKKTHHRLLPIILADATIAVALLVSGFLPGNSFGFVIFVIINFFSGAMIPSFESPFNTLIQQSFPEQILGRIIGLSTAIMTLAGPVGLAFAGPLAEYIGIENVFKISGIGALLGIFYIISQKDVMNLDKM